MKQQITTGMAAATRWIDDLLVPAYLRCFNEAPGLLIFLFHVVFEDRAEMDLNLVDPQQATTLARYRQFIEYYLGEQYRFVSPEHVLQGLDPAGRYVLMTFDDGYFNNQRMLPILNEYRVPAAFYIATDHVRNNEAFWWDVIYRERKKQGRDKEAIQQEVRMLKESGNAGIQGYLVEHFGAGALKPVSDLDRPFRPDELREFSRQPYVHIGNHTANHAILTKCAPEEVEHQVLTAQRAIESMTGGTPRTFAYPNGNYSSESGRILRRLGFKLAMTCDFRKNRMPLDLERDGLKLGRFSFSSGDEIANEAPLFRSDVSAFVGMKKCHRWISDATLGAGR